MSAFDEWWAGHESAQKQIARMAWEAKPTEKVAMGLKPDPDNFTVMASEVVNGHTIVLAKYHGCAQYDGDKLMVLEGEPTFETLDPHFIEGHPVVARFKPTRHGWALARSCAEAYEPENYPGGDDKG